jgi:tetratricopeptide (TPR) repeat protein
LRPASANQVLHACRKDTAAAAYRAAIALRPDYADAHFHLGQTLFWKRDLGGAVVEFRRTLVLDPKNVEAYRDLGAALDKQGKFGESLKALRRARELGTARQTLGPWLLLWAWERGVEKRTKLEAKLPAYLDGKLQVADTGDRLDLAEVAHARQRHATAARFFRDVFTAWPLFAGAKNKGYRYEAACSAARAGCRQSEDACKLNDQEAAGWRQQALDWLRADFRLWQRQLSSSKPDDRAGVRRAMRLWQLDADLACVRDQAALTMLACEERDKWQAFWAEVANLLKKARAKPR